MQVYLVGGAVRDPLLGLPVAERDWVVVGSTPAELEARGFRPVGREFPVFLHPQTHEEYALARLERKSGPGYRGFVTDFSPLVTLEEDLKRRDLTINAMARAADGTLVDPYGGERDLAARTLRHVSEAFAEDPVRILRVARFIARFAPLGFTIAPETLALMRTMVANGEVDALVPERVWREFARALQEPRGDLFITTLADCGALTPLLPELAAYLAQPATRPATERAPSANDDHAWADHPALRALRLAASAGLPAPARFAALLARLPPADVEALCGRLRAPAEYRDLALLAARLGMHLRTSDAAPLTQAPNPERLLGLLELADAWRRPERFGAWLDVLSACSQAGDVPLPVVHAFAARLQAALDATARIRLNTDELKTLQGPQIAARLRALRLEALGTLPPP